MSPFYRCLLILLAILVGTTVIAIRANEYRDPRRSEKDFAVDYAAARAWRADADPFPPDSNVMVNRYLNASGPVVQKASGTRPYWHPPFGVVTVIPFTALRFELAGVLWLLLSAGCVVAAAVLFGRELGYPGLTSAAIGMAALGLPAVQSDLSWGQFNGPILLLFVIAWRSLRHERTTPSWAIGAAAALKIFPALVCVPLLKERKWRAVGAAAVAAVAATTIGFAVIGFDRFAEVVRLSRGYSLYGATRFNISIGGQLRYFFSGLSATATNALVFAAGIALLVASEPKVSLDSFWGSVPIVLLTWPVVWDHYMTIALPWFALAILQARGPWRQAMIFSLVVSSAGVQSVGGHAGSYLATVGLLIGVAFDRGFGAAHLMVVRSDPPLTN